MKRPGLTLLILALWLLQPAWYLWLSPPTVLPPWFAATAMALPLLPALLLALLGRPGAGFWGGLAALFHFSHGVTELWANPAVMALAATETALSVALVVAASWQGLKARAARRRSPPTE